VWEVVTESFATTFAGWDYDPRTTTQFWETCFHFQADLPPDKWFYQKPIPREHIYWVSIAAVYYRGNGDVNGDGRVDQVDMNVMLMCVGMPPSGMCARCDLNGDGVIDPVDVHILDCMIARGWSDPTCGMLTYPQQYPWGWKTRPHFYMDDAVRIFNPTAPRVGTPYVNGLPIEYPEGTSWDASFVLGTRKARITGTITLQNYSWMIAGKLIPVTVRLTDSGGNITYRTVYVDATGAYVIENVDPETYQVAFKASHWLRRAVNGVIVTDQDVGPIDVSLINGDVDDDNYVGLTDFAAWKAANNSYPGDPNWNDNADLNGDGYVGLTDFAVWKSNNNTTGDD